MLKKPLIFLLSSDIMAIRVFFSCCIQQHVSHIHKHVMEVFYTRAVKDRWRDDNDGDDDDNDISTTVIDNYQQI